MTTKETQQLSSVILTNKDRLELGLKLYDEIEDLVLNSGNSEAFVKFDKDELKKIERIYLKYKYIGTSALTLFNFLSLCSLYRDDCDFFSQEKDSVLEDVSEVLLPNTVSEDCRKILLY